MELIIAARAVPASNGQQDLRDSTDTSINPLK
jgi:hypothetical protein